MKASGALLAKGRDRGRGRGRGQGLEGIRSSPAIAKRSSVPLPAAAPSST